MALQIDSQSETLMRQALEAAVKCDWKVHPNPKVGCALLLKSGQVLTGYHAKFGAAHAEIEALSLTKSQGLCVEGATVAVTLEPCSHFGKTPPCADALIKAGVKKVLVGSLDPNSLVSGRGVQKLKDAGIEVHVGVLQTECEAINTEWLFAHRFGRPYVRLKLATSLDGFWTSKVGTKEIITGEEARTVGHALRSRAQVIVTGRGTVEVDDPELTVRLDGYQGPQPKVYVLSRKLDFSLQGKKLSQPVGRTKVFQGDLTLLNGKLLTDESAYSVLVEAGPKMSQAFLESPGLVQEVWHFVAPRNLGHGLTWSSMVAKASLPGGPWQLLQRKNFSNGDELLIYHSKTF